MSDILLATIAGVFSAASLWASTRFVRKRREKRDKESAAEENVPPKLEGLSIQLGDVVWVEGDDRWLAGAVVARDAGQIYGVVFVSPEGAKQKAVVVFPPPVREIFWLSPVAIECPSEPPGALDIEAVAFSRRGRSPVTLERLGQGAPRVGKEALFAVYEAEGREVAVILRSPNETLAWVGKRYDEGEYERLGAGGEG